MYVRKVLNRSAPIQGRSSPVKACIKRGRCPSRFARGGSCEAHKHQNQSPDLGLTDIPRWKPKSMPLVEHCSAIPCHSMLWRDVTLQFVPYFDIVFDVIACT